MALRDWLEVDAWTLRTSDDAGRGSVKALKDALARDEVTRGVTRGVFRGVAASERCCNADAGSQTHV